MDLVFVTWLFRRLRKYSSAVVLYHLLDICVCKLSEKIY